jgi:hypothetical protein
MLMVDGSAQGTREAVGDGGKVRKGGLSLCREVYRGSKSNSAGVVVRSRMVKASFDIYNEAVLDRIRMLDALRSKSRI